MLKILEFLLEIIFPSKNIEKRVKKMTFDDFSLLLDVGFEKEINILSFFKYNKPIIREAVWQMKYRKNSGITKIFAEIIYSEILEEISDSNMFGESVPLLIPIPMGKHEKRKRGYNQTELLAEEIIKLDKNFIDYNPNLLRKTKETKRQTKLRKYEREENIRGAFEVLGNVKNKNIILLDDVYTTGATLLEARKVLKEAGAKNVLSVVVAS